VCLAQMIDQPAPHLPKPHERTRPHSLRYGVRQIWLVRGKCLEGHITCTMAASAARSKPEKKPSIVPVR
jgi:hypothetical protein